MTGKETIKKTLIDNDIYPRGEINAALIYKDWEGWHIKKFGEQSWNAGSSVAEVLSAIRDIAESRER